MRERLVLHRKSQEPDLKWVISFIGHAPADDPKFAIYIVLDEPDGTTGTSGSTSDALILAKDIMTEPVALYECV